MFQLLYTLAVFAEVGLQHNDLHDDNVFVDVANKQVDDQYVVTETRCFQHNSRFLTRLYDFDRGVKLPTRYNGCQINNTGLDRFCDAYGQCPELNVRADLFRVVYFCYQKNNSSETPNEHLNRFLQFIVPVDLLEKSAQRRKNDLAWAGALCFCRQDGCDTCKRVTDRRIKTPKQVLQSTYFDQFLVECTDPDAWHLPSQSALMHLQ